MPQLAAPLRKICAGSPVSHHAWGPPEQQSLIGWLFYASEVPDAFCYRLPSRA